MVKLLHFPLSLELTPTSLSSTPTAPATAATISSRKEPAFCPTTLKVNTHGKSTRSPIMRSDGAMSARFGTRGATTSTGGAGGGGGLGSDSSSDEKVLGKPRMARTRNAARREGGEEGGAGRARGARTDAVL
eukprot:CAMPEP_0184717220 /NCGR_PEP_ID=MMETSP0314-20130426/6766_1 /TAXON_ID=38298 /ORGANISM="Rhodella maculata, Strain CCMP 736" /LENGTH=131 /DNA_ID=CAMNT_0027180759 /DNA_START=146 /DNA_END=541 /DNA_ORIENTATION=-